MNYAIILAAGKSRRFESSINKLLTQVHGEPMIAHTIACFDECALIDEIIIATRIDDKPYVLALLSQKKYLKKIEIVEGGTRRSDSVWNGLQSIKSIRDADVVCIHDGARCLITKELVEQSILDCGKYGSSVLAIPVTDTLKEVSENYCVLKTHPRDHIWRMQTPQTFKTKLIYNAYAAGIAENFEGTDDASFMERLSQSVHVTLGSEENMKVTTASDLKIAEAILAKRK